MHESVMKFGRRVITDAAGKRILEVGAYNINGSLRPDVMRQGPKVYIGTDLVKCNHGNGNNPFGCKCEPYGCADIVIPGEELCKYFLPEIFDIIISTEALEHVVDWKTILININTLLTKDGYFLLTTRSPGFGFHEAPLDMWRYTLKDMRTIFGNADIIEDDPQAPGVFVKARKVSEMHKRLAGLEIQRMIKT